MTVRATINPIPPGCLPKDCNTVEEAEDRDVEIKFDEEEMVACCAVQQLYNFTDSRDQLSVGTETIPERFLAGALSALGDYKTHNGMALFAVNDHQDVVARAAEETGWTKMAEFRNPGSGNRIRMYGKLFNQPRTQGGKKRR